MVFSIGFWILVFAIPLTKAARKWDYEFVAMTTTTSDPSKLAIEIKIVRLGRGDFALSGTIEWKYDETEQTIVEGSAYVSSSGAESDYKLLPWSIPKTPYYEFLKTYYKDVFLANVGHCSNFPQFEEKFQPPFPKATYKLDKCKLTGDGMPEIAPPGFYKIIFTVSGPDQPTWGFTVILKVTNKFF